MLVGQITTIYSASGVTTSVNGSAVTLSNTPERGVIFRLNATENSGTSTLDVKVEHSPTGAANTWKTLCDFSQLSASGMEDVHILSDDRGIWPALRVVITITGTGNWDIGVICGSIK